jgi:beta-glucosidase
VNEAYSISLIDGLTNAGFSIDTELEGMYKPYAADKKAKNWNVVKEKAD